MLDTENDNDFFTDLFDEDDLDDDIEWDDFLGDGHTEVFSSKYSQTLINYYDSKEWQQKRDQRLRWNKILNNGLCERCNNKFAYHVHHRSYEHLGREHPFDLECLCKECHELVHGKELQY